ncbi:hypothetical protein B0A52_06441 [Exophiala mesophila]|uniref:Zn(2)-C6 fungal-type domain-containing protein n=1 Tax=Exophiala mesophila TaxID=212818 RepID=A0A438N289_EXOME|nr:hypothetical protein B0A52_06441 [Exophiala mesophila]
MVGVPGRSKGCHTCLKRRVKCGECHSVQLDAAQQPITISVAGQMKPDHPTDSATLTKAVKKPPSFPSGFSDFYALRSSDQTPSSVPQELNLSAFRDNIQFSYLFSNFVWSTYGSPWLQMSAEGKVDALALEACRAFSLTIFGKHHHQPEIEVNGAVHYDKAVRALSFRLSNVGAPGSEDMIVPIMILLMHSSSIPDPQASAFHIQGLLKLVQICGPQRYTSPLLRSAFESCRATLTTVALITKIRTFLELSEWLTEPWAEIGAANKSFQNQLVDILVYIPGFLQDQANLEQEPNKDLEHDLIRRIEFQIQQLFQWRWRWEETNRHAAWEIDQEQLPPETSPNYYRPVKNVMMFSSFSRAAEICLYDAVLLCLLGLLWTLAPPNEKTPSPCPPSSYPLYLPGDVSSLTEPAVEICRAFEYQLLHATNISDSVLFWLFPLGLASKVLEDDPIMMRWVRSMLEQSQATRNYGTGSSTVGFGFYKFPTVRRRKGPLSSLMRTGSYTGSIRHCSEDSSEGD